MKISIDVSEVQGLKGKMQAARQRIRLEKPGLLRRIGNLMRRLGVKAYTELSGGGSAIGIRWKRLSSEYKQWKQRKGYSSRIGIRTGLQRRSHLVEITGVRAVSLEYNVRETSLEGNTGYHVHFDRDRPFFRSTNVPPSWMRSDIEPEIARWLEETVQKELKGA